MAKSDARFGYEAKLGRTDFDLGQKLGFTCAPGMLLPIWFDWANPGDSYYMQHDLSLLRTAPLAAPAMIDVKVHYETFFVPIQMIFQPFENQYYSTKPILSSNFNPSSFLANNALPQLDYAQLVTDAKASPYGNTDVHADCFRMADLFGMCADNFTAHSYIEVYTFNMFPWQLCAYHTIFQNYYRLDDKTEYSNLFCNLDRFYATGTFTLTPEFMKIYQRPWDFDYFTSSYRSPIVSNANLQDVLPLGYYSDLISGNRTKPVARDGSNILTGNNEVRSYATSAGTSYYPNNLQASTSAAMIRQAFANEKLAMITGRTRKNYDSQVLAHLGIAVPHDPKHDITCIHHDEYDLFVNEVTSLAHTEDAPLGELAGKSYATGNGKQFKFTAPCHGVMMTIFSVEPKRRYFGGFDLLNCTGTVTDLPIPEYDRLGNQPVYLMQSQWYKHTGDTRTNTDVVAWKERYYPFKRKYDKITHAFGYGDQRQGVNNYSSYFLGSRPFGNIGVYRSGGYDSGDPMPQDESRYYIPREAMDLQMLVGFSHGWIESGEEEAENWNKTPWLVYARDPFIVNSNIKCKKVSWMSKDGEPIYNF